MVIYTYDMLVLVLKSKMRMNACSQQPISVCYRDSLKSRCIIWMVVKREIVKKNSMPHSIKYILNGLFGYLSCWWIPLLCWWLEAIILAVVRRYDLRSLFADSLYFSSLPTIRKSVFIVGNLKKICQYFNR